MMGYHEEKELPYSVNRFNRNTLEVISRFHEKFEVEVLTAYNNVQLIN
jgi:hypothetical protein